MNPPLAEEEIHVKRSRNRNRKNSFKTNFTESEQGIGRIEQEVGAIEQDTRQNEQGIGRIEQEVGAIEQSSVQTRIEVGAIEQDTNQNEQDIRQSQQDTCRSRISMNVSETESVQQKIIGSGK